jgi:hypothetical protein
VPYGGAANTNVIVIALVLSDPESAIYRILGEYANNYTTDDINCTLVFKDSHSKLTVTHRNLKVNNSNLNVTHIDLKVTHSNHIIRSLFTLMQKNQQQNKQKNT